MFGPVCEECYQDIEDGQPFFKDKVGNLFCSEKCKKAFQEYYDGIGDFDEDKDEPEEGIL